MKYIVFVKGECVQVEASTRQLAAEKACNIQNIPNVDETIHVKVFEYVGTYEITAMTLKTYKSRSMMDLE